MTTEPDLPSRPTLFVVASPIGNLGDISIRACQILRSVDLIACEDTRKTGFLLKKLEIKPKKLMSYYEAQEEKKTTVLIKAMLEDNLLVALLSDAGTPAISDPGYRLVAAARKNKIPVSPIPGVSSPIALASVSGLPTDRILFTGFLAKKKSARLKEITSWKHIKASIIFLESAQRLKTTLNDLAELYPHGQIAIGRELTKKFEEIVVLSLKDSLTWLANKTSLKGEFTLMCDLKIKNEVHDIDENMLKKRVLELLSQKVSARDIARSHLSDLHLTRSEAYKKVQEILNSSKE